MKRRAAISRLVSPSGSRREICLSCAVSWSKVSGLRLRVASSSTRARSPKASMPKSEKSP
jgi:hypothetical protein